MEANEAAQATVAPVEEATLEPEATLPGLVVRDDVATA